VSGKDHYEAGRAAGDEVARCGPQVVAGARANRAFLARASATLDFARPVAVLLLAVLHFLPGSDGPARIVAGLARALAPGSYLAISHLTADLYAGIARIRPSTPASTTRLGILIG
jgi:S-adenosyl methyltransferase